MIGVTDSVASAHIDRRVLRRVARHFGGASIRAVPLAGGLTGLAVWHCRIMDASSNEVASVVVKRSDASGGDVPGGLHTLLPAPYVASPFAVVTGLCSGYKAQVMQIAGASPVSLLALLPGDDAEAAAQLGLLADAMDAALAGPESMRTIAEIAEPLSSWEALSSRLRDDGIEPPRGSLRASTCLVAQHGDLHPGNVLVSNGHPVLIDFDSETVGSKSLDAVTALLSPLFHRDSPLRAGEWPCSEQCADLLGEPFLEGSPVPQWTRRAQKWVHDTSSGERERWALILAYVTRQMKYSDVADNAVVRGRALAIAALAASRLRES